MVAKVKCPDYDSKRIIQEIVRDRVKQRDFFVSLEDDWLEQLDLYILKEGNPFFVKPLELGRHISKERVEEERQKAFDARTQSSDPLSRLLKKRKANLIGLYKSEAGSDLHTKLSEMRRKNKLRVCPSCGEDGAPGTLDHYLPKEVFPELSICFQNLTPMCDQCQGKKGTSYKNSTGGKRFFHPYYDDINDCFFHIKISPPYEAPIKFELQIVRCEPKQIKTLISHVIGVGLQERIEEYCESMHEGLIDVFLENPSSTSTVDRVKDFYALESKKSPNAWGAIYYKSVLNTPELLEYLDGLRTE
ncbi:hypothetical protein ACK32X_11860 [Aeromonas dhakensis]|uniref:hypothetical protein n=1 Tax=Aeromonas TaxID=642 RepID=UPI002ED63B7E|nr:hypothetical protein V0242_07200 [Aeromonas hydrophila]